jgi:competence protein ComEC
VPLTALWMMPAGLLALALMPLHLEALALLPMGWGAAAVLWIGRAVSALPSATIAVPRMPLWGLGVVALGMAWLGLWRTRTRLAGVPVLLFGLASPVLERPPDILLAADGRLAGLRIGRTMFLQQGDGFSGFTQDAWQQMWAADPVRALPDQPEPGLSCTPRLCAFRPRDGGPTALLLLTHAARADCAADVLLSLEPIRLHCPDPEPWMLDRFSVWRDGAQAVWLDPDGVRVLSDRDARGDRPWVPPEPD